MIDFIKYISSGVRDRTFKTEMAPVLFLMVVIVLKFRQGEELGRLNNKVVPFCLFLFGINSFLVLGLISGEKQHVDAKGKEVRR